MTTTASKLFFGAAAFALLAAWVYGWGTGGGFTGVMLFGLLGGVGELTGYTVLVGVAAVLAGLGAAASVLRDADPELQAAAVGLDRPPAVSPAGPSYWPAVGAFSVVAVLVGLVASPVLFVIGALGALVVAVEWMVTAWSERATGDPLVNQQVRAQLMRPLEIPVGAALLIVVLVASFSRIFLTLEARATSITAIVLGALILGAGFAVAYRPHLSKDLIASLLLLGGLVAIGAGIAAAAAGPRDFEHHETDDAGHEGESVGHPASPLHLELTQ